MNSETSTMTSEERRQMRRANFERYRILVLNEFDKSKDSIYALKFIIGDSIWAFLIFSFGRQVLEANLH